MATAAPIIPSPYRLGVALAGGATAGAFEAGAMDFLLEALTELSAHSPTYPLALSDMAGTSAGGITSSLFIASLNSGFKPVSKTYVESDPSPTYNPLFTTMVDKMTFDGLLVTSDISLKNPEVSSLLCGNFFHDVSTEVLTAVKESALVSTLPSLIHGLQFSLTATNLRGIPYEVPNLNTGAEKHLRPRLRQHCDWTTFAVHTDETTVLEASLDHCNSLNISRDRGSDQWKHVITCTCATAAFPMVFPPVKITTPRAVYGHRANVAGLRPPDWSADDFIDNVKNPSPDYTYTAVDGGVMNNEPFTLLQRSMRRRYGLDGSLPLTRNQGAILLIDPFPTSGTDPKINYEGMSIPQSLTALLGALRGQAMFTPRKVQDPTPLEKKEESDDLVRFVVAPRRNDTAGGRGKGFNLAAGAMGGFSGALHRRLRVHDYMLGRANCQQFLRDTFVMTRAEMKESIMFEKEHYGEGDDAEIIPIIPLVGTAKKPCTMPEWPTLTKKEITETTNRIVDLIGKRFDVIIGLYFKEWGIWTPARYNPFTYAQNFGVSIVKDMLVSRIQNKARLSIEETLQLFA